MDVINRFLFFLLSIIITRNSILFDYATATTYGYDTSVSIVNPFNIQGTDNRIASLCCVKNGFKFGGNDATITCSFDSVFPVSGPITLNGGKLWLTSDLKLTNTASFTDLGSIYGNNYVLELSPYMSTFNYQTNPNGKVALALAARQTLTKTINSVDWSPDNKYVAITTNSVTGVTPEIIIYSFNGTTFTQVASANTNKNCFSVRWRPTTDPSPTTHYLAVTSVAFSSRTLHIYSFTVATNTLTEVGGANPSATPYYAVSWQGRGNRVAVGGNSSIAFYDFVASPFALTSAGTVIVNGQVSNNAMRWAPLGSPDDLIAGTSATSGANFYLFRHNGGTSISTLQSITPVSGVAVNGLDWSRTSTYMALALNNGSVVTYQHDAATNALTEKTTTSYAQAAKNVSWQSDAKRLYAVYAAGAGDEVRMFSFDTGTYAFTQQYSAEVGQTISAIKSSPNDLYFARADDVTFYLSVYKPVYSQIIFDNVNLFLNQDLTLGSALTFQGICTINGQGNTMSFTGDGTINVAQGGTVNFKLIDVEFNMPNAFALQGPTSTVSFSNATICLNEDVAVGGGSMKFYNDVSITGKHTLSYDSAFTSTIQAQATLTLGSGTTFSIGKSPGVTQNPLEFEASTSSLNLDNATLTITNSGLQLTKGTINIYNNSSFNVNSTDTSSGLILGDGTSSNDVTLTLYGSATTLTLTNGALTFNSYSPTALDLKGLAKFSLSATSSLYIQRPLMIQDGHIKTSPGASLYVNPNAYLTTDNTRIIDLSTKEDFYLTGTLKNIDSIVLDNGGKLLLNHGPLLENIFIQGYNNEITGNGRFDGSLKFMDHRSTISWNLLAKLNNESIDLKGGKIIMTQDSGLANGYTFLGTGTVALENFVFNVGADATTWNNNIYWDSNGATIKLNNNVVLDGIWTFSGNCILDGRGFKIDLDSTGSIVVERGSRLVFKDVVILNLTRNSNLFCQDNAAEIIFDGSTLSLEGNCKFEKGKCEFRDDNQIMSGDGLDNTFTLSYESIEPINIVERATISIHDRTRIALGRKNGSSATQPLTFTDATASLILNGGTLHITSSGATLTKGRLLSLDQSSIEVDCPHADYGLILGDGLSIDNDFLLSIDGGSKLTLKSGKIFYNNILASDRLRFANDGATLQIEAPDGLTAKTNMTLRNGIIEFADDCNLASINAAVVKQENIIHIYESPFSTNRIQINTTIPYELSDGNYFYATEGESTHPLVFTSGTASFGGSGILSSPITIRHGGITAKASLVGPLKNNITMNGGTLYLDNDLYLASDKTLTGSGTIEGNNCKFSFGGADNHITNTILWQNTAVDILGKKSLSGTWTFQGECNLNGHGNVLDLSPGGNIALYPNTTLYLTDINLKGLGTNYGSIDFLADTAELRLSKTNITLNNNVTTTVGGIYVDGLSTVGFKNHNWLLDNNASMTIDGVTLWQDPVGVTNHGKFTFGSGSLSKYLTLILTGTIKTYANLDIVTTNTNSLLNSITAHTTLIRTYSNAWTPLMRTNSNSILYHDGLIRTYSNAWTPLMRTNSNSINYHDRLIRTYSNAWTPLMRTNSNAIVTINDTKTITTYTSPVNYTNNTTVNDAVLFKNGFTVAANKTVTLNTSLPVSGSINLYDSGTINLSNDLSLESDAALTSGGNISGNGNSVILTNNLTIPDDNDLHIRSDTIIDGQGHNLIMGQGAKLIIDPSVTLTLKNINWFNTLTVPPIEMRGATSGLALQNTNICFDRDYSFTQGRMYIHQDVMITGSKQFTYASINPMTIEPFSMLYFDTGTTFSYSPGESRAHTTNERNLIRLYDETSKIHFNSCTINIPDFGLQLTKGKLIFENKITFNGNIINNDEDHSFEWGTGVAGNDLAIAVLAGARIDTNGFIYHHPAT